MLAKKDFEKVTDEQSFNVPRVSNKNMSTMEINELLACFN